MKTFTCLIKPVLIFILLFTSIETYANSKNVQSSLQVDPICVSIEGATVIEPDEGSSTVTLNLTLNRISNQAVKVHYSTTSRAIDPYFPENYNATAKWDLDFTGVGGYVTFYPGELSKQISVVVKGDKIDEDDEFFYVHLTHSSNAVLCNSEVAVLIIDNDNPPVLAVNDMAVKEQDEGQVQMKYYVNLSSHSGKEISFEYFTEQGTARAGSDYIAKSGKLIIPPGQTRAEFVIPVLGDTEIEPTEKFKVKIFNAQNAVLSKNELNATIWNDDGTLPAINITGSAEVQEDADSVVFYITLSKPSTDTVKADIKTNSNSGYGFATPDLDFNTLDQRLVFLPGETSKAVAVYILEDTLSEPNEVFNVSLTNFINSGHGHSVRECKILDSESITLIQSPLIVQKAEDNGNVFIKLNLSRPAPDTVRVQYATQDSTAIAGQDYISESGIVTFLPGQTEQSISVAAILNTGAESTEYFFVNYTAATGAVLANNRTTVAVYDFYDKPSLYTEVGKLNVIEGTGGITNVDVKILLSHPTHLPVPVYLYVGGRPGIYGPDAVNGSDYEQIKDTITIPAGDTSILYTVKVIADNLYEPEEVIQLNVDPIGDVALPSGGIDSDLYLYIENDDNPPLIYIDDVSIPEGNAPTYVNFKARLDKRIATIVRANITPVVNGIEQSPFEISAENFTSGNSIDSLIEFSYLVNGDLIIEPDETIVFKLSNPYESTIGDSTGIITLLNDDGSSLKVTVNVPDSIVANEGEDFYLTFFLTNPLDASFNYSTENGTAINGLDYQADNSTANFFSNTLPDFSYSYGFGTYTDDLIEGTEYYYINLSTPSNPNLILTNNRVKIVLMDKTEPSARSGSSSISSVDEKNSRSKITNVFTPNGDGINDLFVIPNLETSVNELQVFNKQGMQVYKRSNYQNDWDGQGCADGTYFYSLKLQKASGEYEVKKGYITLIRSLK
ncbi:hypothetical protein C3K47_16200 [Solitalea longa]|uniref:Calx-beta domain-containing protein n=1 Tax=Solitalea longa TaxID=2079460 RepID=A0A2S4ZYC8_9SPHI|nr:Calx-beta domain-containing protein [Solitalea longa]POY35325.1 hypothetical protein C3K47_16200 [Solitalea longa]